MSIQLDTMIEATVHRSQPRPDSLSQLPGIAWCIQLKQQDHCVHQEAERSLRYTEKIEIHIDPSSLKAILDSLNLDEQLNLYHQMLRAVQLMVIALVRVIAGRCVCSRRTVAEDAGSVFLAVVAISERDLLIGVLGS